MRRIDKNKIKDKKKKKFKFTKRGVIRATVLLTLYLMLVYCIMCLVFYFIQDEFLYQPTAEITATPEDIGRDYEDIVLTTSDGESLGAWYIPNEGSNITVLYATGTPGTSGAIYRITRYSSNAATAFLRSITGVSGRARGSPRRPGRTGTCSRPGST